MKNLTLFLDDDTKVFECIISNHTGIVKIHRDTKMTSLQSLVESVIDGNYLVEFEDKTLDTSKVDSIFERIDMFKNEDSFNVNFDVITPEKVLDYFYGESVPYKKDIEEIVRFFNIELIKTNDIPGIGEALFSDDKFIVKYKDQYYRQREIFTIAHELGHILLHFATDKKIHFEDFDEALKPINDVDFTKELKAARDDTTNYNKVLEDEADCFARDLLAPRFQLESYINKFNEIYEEKPYMSDLRNSFGVSNGTIYYALKDANLIHKVIDNCRPW